MKYSSFHRFVSLLIRGLLAPFMLLVSLPAYSQWVSQNSGTTTPLYAVHFADVNTGVAVGLFGKILRTTNDGASWINVSTVISSHILSVFLVNNNTGWLVGDATTLAKTTDSGQNWVLQSPALSENLRGVFFTDVNTGYVVGGSGTIIKTTNGGTNWFSQNSGSSTWLLKVYFPTPAIGTIVGYDGTILRTTNAGVNWNSQNSGTNSHLYTVYFVSSDVGYTAGEGGIILKTLDGGQNWVQQNAGTNPAFYGIYFANANTGTLVGLSNRIFRTTNGGLNWIAQLSGTNQDFNSVTFKGTVDTGTLVGSSGTILHTTTGGYSPPPAPNLIAPPNGALNVSVTPLLDWDSLSEASSYGVQISADSLFLSFALDTSNIINSHLQVQPGTLLNNTRYYWRVRGRNSVGFGQWSAVWRFTTIVAVPNPPNLLLPLNNASNVPLNPSFDWDSTSPVTFYRLQVSLDSLFVNPGIDITGITVSFLNLTDDTLRNNGRYFWRVSATNIAGTSQWSAVFRFATVISFPPPPLLHLPPNGSINVPLTPLLDWFEDVSAITYTLQVSVDSSFSSPVINLSNITASQYQVPAATLSSFTRYYWRVRTNTSLGTSQFSEIWNFTTLQTVPPPPTLVSPPNGASNVSLTPLLDWDTIPYCTYRVQVTDDSTFNSTLINVGGLTSAHYQVSGGSLSNNTCYWWRINATNSAGTGPWSLVWRFCTIIGAPVSAPFLIAPPNNSTGLTLTPMLDWTNVFSATGYRVQAAIDSSFSSAAVDTAVPVSQFNVPAGRLAGNTRYFWRARAFNIGGTSPWSEIWNFTTQPVGISIIGSETPKEFSLYQNYPNPFNPATTIRFDIPASNSFSPGSLTHRAELVKLIIYNILGQEIKQLFNLDLLPGKYETQWNASEYPSGAYFYILITAEYTDVKRMVLVK